MKTLKQLREEYKNSYMSQVEHLPEELMLEKNVIPSTKEMPSLIVFRRVSFRSYPKGQVVALYYSKLMDKYLSVPIGPGDSVNLSEACWKDYEQVGMKKKNGKSVPNCVPVKEDGPGNPSYTTRPTYEHFKDKLDKLREEKMEEGIVGDTIQKARKSIANNKAFKVAQEIGHHLPGYEDVKDAKQHFAKGEYKDAAKSAVHSLGKAAATGAAVAGAVGAGVLGARALGKSGLAKLAKKALGGEKDKKGSDTSEPESKPSEIHSKTPGVAKTSSSWDKAPTSDPVYQSKAKQAAIAPVKENKITDIRDMIKEGVDSMDLSINGRTVTLNTFMAKRILEVYDSVNTKNKKLVEGMLNEDLESFKKLINFSIRN